MIGMNLKILNLIIIVFFNFKRNNNKVNNNNTINNNSQIDHLQNNIFTDLKIPHSSNDYFLN